MFEIGEGVVHPVRGAGHITDIEYQTIGGEPRKYYVIDMVAGDMKLLVPVENAEEIGLRRKVDPAKAERLLAAVSAPAQLLPKEPKERHVMLGSILSGEDMVRKAEGLRDLGWRRHRQRLPAGDESAFRRLRHLLAGEIALALGVGFDEALALLGNSMRKSFSESTEPGEGG